MTTLEQYQLDICGQNFFVYSIGVLKLKDCAADVIGEAISSHIEDGHATDDFITKYATISYEQIHELLDACQPHIISADEIIKAAYTYFGSL